MDGIIWLLLITMAVLLWASTSLLYKAGIHKGKETHTCLKVSVCVGMVFLRLPSSI